MRYLDEADRDAQAGRDLRTYGGRRGRDDGGGNETAARIAASGRYGRNALIQGAAAELFKMWAVTVRARGAPLGARIVLCLHDELIVHAACGAGRRHRPARRRLPAGGAARWAPGRGVRFISDTSIVHRWSDAKATAGPATSHPARDRGLLAQQPGPGAITSPCPGSISFRASAGPQEPGR